MLTPATQFNLSNARNYFKEHLAHGDYYSEKETVQGEWQGAGAELLGVSGAVTQEQFLRLCEGLHPVTGEQLTARHNTSRRGADGKEMANRRVFYDWVFRPSKSVSLHAFLHEPGIIQDHNEAVKVALRELERYAETRVRAGKQMSDRRTGNVVVAKFRHDTSREQDPLLHTHCVMFNATFDPVEKRWKALQNSEMLKAQKFVRNVYHHELAKRLQSRGLPLRRTKIGFEIEGYTQAEIEKFSKRRMQIQQLVKLERAKPGSENLSDAELRDRIAHEHRARKIKDANADTLRKKWRDELGEAGFQRTGKIKRGAPIKVEWNVANAFEWAKEQVFERKSVVRLHELEAATMSRLQGAPCTIEEVRAHCLKKHAGLVFEEGTDRVTSREALEREMRIVNAAREGRGTVFALVPDVEAALAKSKLDDEQKNAAAALLGGADEIMIFRGRAGTGKSFTLKTVYDALAEAKRTVIVCAPQTGQVQDLTKDGMPAKTIATVLTYEKLAKGCIVIADEAGQIGGKTMDELIRLVREAEGRLILSGDTRQHGAVEASDALRAIEKHAEVRMAEIKTNRRQNPNLAQSDAERAKIEAYRDAVNMAADGQTSASLRELEKIGVVTVIPEKQRVATVAKKYIESRAAGLATLVVTETRAERDAINGEIAAALSAKGDVKDERLMQTFAPVDTGTAERALSETYRSGHYLRWIKNYGVHQRGTLEKVVDANEHGILLEGSAKRIAYSARAKFDVVEEKELRIGVGSRLQTRLNAKAVGEEKLVNGELVTVRAIGKDGTLQVENSKGVRKAIKPEQRVVTLGYCVTSYASQGKTADKTLIADAGSAGASSQGAWYVSISRGRRDIEIVTSSVDDLAKRIGKDGARELALELASSLPAPQRNAVEKAVAKVGDLARQVGRASIVHAQTAGKVLKQAAQNVRDRLNQSNQQKP